MHEKILEACRDRGITQRALAQRLQVTTTQLGKWCHAQGRPYWDQLRSLAEALDVPLDWLADDAAELPVPPRGTRHAILTPEEELLLRQVRTMGVEEAARRLVNPILLPTARFRLVQEPPTKKNP